MNNQKRLLIWKQRIPHIVFLAPFTIAFTVFTILPIMSSIFLSFTHFNMLEQPRFLGFQNYIRMFFDDEVFLIAVRNTLILALITGPIGFVLSFLIAWFINEFNPFLRKTFTFVFYSPILAGNVFFIWTYVFSQDSYGLVNSILLKSGIVRQPVQWLTDPKFMMFVVVLVLFWLSMGTGFLAFVAGLQNLDPQLNEAGAIDGIRNRFQELWFVTIPQMVPTLLFGAVMSISASFAVGYESMALTGFPSTDYAAHTLVLHIMDYGIMPTHYELGYASAIAVFLFGIMLLVWRLISKALSSKGA